MVTNWSELRALEPGLCSWCLHLTEEAALRKAMEGFGLRAIQLALAPIAELPAKEQARAIAEFRASPMIITCGMIAYPGENYSTRETIHQTGGLVPDDTFESRYALTLACGRVGHELGLTMISTHVGFIPSPADKAAFEKIRTRLGRVCDEFAKGGISLLFETGQETAQTLVSF